ncbi:MAG: IS110 family transposase [Lawsonibacter sp.]
MLSIGIDVSKGKSTVCGMKPGGEIVYAPFEVQHTREGMSELVSLPRQQRRRGSCRFGKHRQLPLPGGGLLLLENGIFVSVVNSLRMKRFCSQSIRKVKTDRIDAMQIALYGLAYWQELQPTRLPEDTYRELQLLARQYYQMTSMLIKAKVDFNALCDQVLPGMQELMSDHAGRHKLSDFVLRYRHTTHILEMGETRFRKDYCKWAEKRDTAIANVWQCSSLPQLKNGIPVLPNAPSTQIVITEAIRVLHTVEASRDAILTQMQALAKTLPEYSSRARNALHRGHAGSAPDCGDRRCPTLSTASGLHRIRRHRCAAVPVR